MNGVKILISPLSWGFGHAGRMIPLALELRRRGCEVYFAADTLLLQMAEKELPGITVLEIPGLRIRYSRLLPQYICISLQLPVIIMSAVRDHLLLRRLVKQISPSVIISDNRFGFFHRGIFSVYVTHQIRIPLPGLLGIMEPIAALMHRLIISRYDLCLVPDYPGDINLSGRLSHSLITEPVSRSWLSGKLVYMGPLSRFAMPGTNPAETPVQPHSTEENPFQPSPSELDFPRPPAYGVDLSQPSPSELDFPQPRLNAGDFFSPAAPYACLVLSGPEPQRTLLLEKVMKGLSSTPLVVLTATPVHNVPREGNSVQYIVSPGTATMRRIITGASLVITRAGYTSIMELASLNMSAVLIPTPGQPEQEYLGKYLHGRYGFVTMKQNRLKPLATLAEIITGQSAAAGDDDGSRLHLPDPAPLFENAINLLSEQEKK